MDVPPPSSSPSVGPARPSGPRLVDSPALTLAGFGARHRPETLDQIPAQWGRFGAQVGEVSEPTGPAAFGLCHEWRGRVHGPSAARA